MISWLAELIYVVGWEGEKWGTAYLNTVYLICFFVVLSYLSPVLIFVKVKFKNFIITFTILYISSILAYYIAKKLFIELYHKMPEDKHVIYVWLLIVLVTVVAFVFFYIKQMLLYKSDRFHVMTLVAVFISVVPASLITLEWIKGFVSTESFIDAVKMGYPIFWLNIFLGLVSYSMVRRLI